MKSIVSIDGYRPTIVCAFILLATQACLHYPSPQVAGTPPPSREQVDMTPWEESAEVRELLYGTFVPDPGEPAGAIKMYLATEEQLRTAWQRIEEASRAGDPDFDPETLLDEILAARRRATALYPMSRHAWQGVGYFHWRRYHWRPRRADLCEAVSAFTRAAELLIPHGTGRMGGRDFYGAASHVAGGLVVLSDTAVLDAFFSKLEGTEFWEGAREIYVRALGALNDPRADRMFRELLAEHPQYPWSYIEYLIDRGRYADALQLVDRTPPFGSSSDSPRPYAFHHARRGALLERLGRLSEAQAEYRLYWDRAPRFFGGYLSPLPERYQVPESPLQVGMKFSPGDVLPKPED